MALTRFHRTPGKFLALVALFIVLILPSITSGQNEIIYVYDELGRLIAVISPAGDTATYHYDSVGNVTSISRYSSAIVSVIEFTPNTGPVGSTVTIYGTGFSVTPSQNTVSFNGTAATVTSSSFTQIVTTVPLGATTGAISVTTPAGSAASSTSFVVGESSPPTITSFSPNIGTPGTVVTVTGTNFDIVPTNNRVKVNTSLTSVSAATANSIDATVSSLTGSGRISVATVSGTATSTADFFVPPSPYTAADVLVTDRMALGDSRTVALGTANKIGLVVFDAAEMQRVSIKTNSSTIASGTITIFNPKGVSIASTTFNTTTGYVDTPLLTATGTYTIMVDPNSTNTGNVNFTLHNASDVPGTMSIDGPSATFSITTPGQNARITFNGTAGQRIGLGMTAVTIAGSSCCSAFVSITHISGQVVLAPLNVGTAGGGTNMLTLPSSGSYTILVDPKTQNIGNIELTLTEELSGTLTMGGPSQNLTLRAGQNARYTFSGTSGQRVSLGMSSVTIGAPNCCTVATAAINNPDGSVLLAPMPFLTSGEGTPSVILPSSGTYSVVIDPSLGKAGNVTLTLSEDLASTIVINGSTVPLSFNFGQNAFLNFAGAAGQRITVGISGVTIGTGHCCDVGSVAIYKPDDTALLSPFGFLTTGNGSATLILPVTGNYTIIVNPYLARSGAATVTLSEDISSTITINGANVPLSLARAGQNAVLTFDGTAGQRVSIGMTAVTIGLGHCCTVASVAIYKPEGTTLLNPYPFLTNGDGTVSVVLPTTGTYSIVVDPFLARTGNVTITLSEDVSGSIAINGSTVPLTFRSGQNGLLTFDGTAGQRITLGTNGITMGIGHCCTVASVAINKPDGSVLMSADPFLVGGEGTPTIVLPVTGTYTIIVNPFIGFSGDVTLTLSEDVSATVMINGSTVPISLSRVGQNGLLTFDGSSGQLVTVRLTSNSLGNTTVKLLNPDGTTLTSSTKSQSSFNLTQVTLPATGTFTITLDPLTIATGSITVAVTNP